MSVRRILLTNDDGVDSPALVPFARALAVLGEIEVVVPDRERSWVGKAISRFDPVGVTETERDGVRIYICTGYPADAVQLGIHALFEHPPDLVVSGINLGYNHGAGFLMSSGTVGAAIEGWVSGIPAVAVSTGAMSNWKAWRATVEHPEQSGAWERLAAVVARLVADVEGTGLASHADVVSINLPFDATDATPRRVTTVARVGYERLFGPGEEGSYSHAFAGGLVHFDALDGTDVDAATEGVVSVTPLLMPQAAILPPDVVAAFER